MSGITTLIIVGAVMFSVLGGITLLAYVYSLNNIKSKLISLELFIAQKQISFEIINNSALEVQYGYS